MKRAILSLATAAVFLLASVAFGANVSRQQLPNDVLSPDTSGSAEAAIITDADLHLRFLDDVLYPAETSNRLDLCDGTYVCVTFSTP